MANALPRKQGLTAPICLQLERQGIPQESGFEGVMVHALEREHHLHVHV